MRQMKSVLIAALLLITVVAYGQKDTSYWTRDGIVNVGYTQTGLTNWAKGGDNSYSLNSFLNYNAKYKKGKNAWDNAFEFAYGLMSTNSVLRKADDKIDISSKYGHQASEKWYYSVNGTFKSQFADGIEYKDDEENFISTFMAPANLIVSLGMDYKPNTHLSVFMSPLSSRTIFVLNDTLSAQGAFGVKPGENIRNEFGATVKAVYEHKEIIKNVGFMTKLELYSNYLENPENVDVNWEVLVVLTINEWLSATVSTQLIYDDNTQIDGVNSKVQFKEIVGVGLAYKF